MNYRHIYHAGNFADVFKHSILIMLMRSLLQKDKQITYLDTHAGIGRYDLGSENSQKTMEYKNGIDKLLHLNGHSNLPLAIQDYLEIVSSFNDPASQEINFYPGSPRIIRSLIRPCDSMILIEKHPEDVLQLKREFRRDQEVAVHEFNGFQSVKAFLPPKKGRGLILMDPAYEDKDEFQNIISAIKVAVDRFPIGMYVIWYPIKDRLGVDRFYKSLWSLDIKGFLLVELSITTNITEDIGLASCGLAIINPPWRFKEQLIPVVDWLSDALAIDETGFGKVKACARQLR